MKKTKIICTVGPACMDAEILKEMVRAGMNVARLNFSHGTHESHRAAITLIRRVREEMGVPLAILLDTKGPEYRIGTFRSGPVTLADGQKFTLTASDEPGDETHVSASCAALADKLCPGDTVLINDGLVRLTVDEIADGDIRCTVVCGGVLSDRKSMNFPGKVLELPYLSEADVKDLLFGVEMDVDYVACSFVSTAQDLNQVRELLKENGGEKIDLIAKIENRAGVEHIDEIIDASDGIMVARGDLGVEIPYEELPAIQKMLITHCRKRGKRVITATEMLESMIQNARPTRAETSDVANAVYDGTSALMLSGETAKGAYPVQAVEAMARIAEETENDINYRKRYAGEVFQIRSAADAISHATCALAMDVNARLIVANTRSGLTARLVSRFRPPMFILGMTTDAKVWHKLSLSWGVVPYLSEVYNSTDVLFFQAMQAAKESGLASSGERVVITGGIINGRSGNTDQIKLVTL